MGINGIYLGCNQADGTNRPIVYSGDRHILLLGPNGSGKTTRFLAQNLILTPLNSAIVIDPKGELTAMTGDFRRRHGRVLVLKPFKARAGDPPSPKSDGFNPLSILDPGDEMFTDDAMSIAEAIISLEDKDKHFPASAQDLVSALIMHVRREYGPKGALADVRRLLTTPTVLGTAKDPITGKDIDGMPIKGLGKTACDMRDSDYEPLRNKGSRYIKATREIDSIISTATTQSRFLDSPPIARDLDLDGVKFADLKKETLTIYVTIPAKMLRTHSAWLRLVIDSALRAMYDTPNTGRPPVNFFIDEAAALENLPVLADAVGIARGFSTRLILCWQDLNQLNDLYQRRFQSFIASAGAIVAFPPRDSFTADQLSKLSGRQTGLVNSVSKVDGQQFGNNPSKSTSVTESTSVTDLPLWRADELMNMNRNQAFLFCEMRERAEMIPVPNYWDIDEIKPHVRPSPYHR